MRLAIACWWAWVRRPGEDLGRGRRREVDSGRFSGVSAGMLVSVSALSSLLDSEVPWIEIWGEVGDRSACSRLDASEMLSGGSDGFSE